MLSGSWQMLQTWLGPTRYENCQGMKAGIDFMPLSARIECCMLAENLSYCNQPGPLCRWASRTTSRPYVRRLRVSGSGVCTAA